MRLWRALAAGHGICGRLGHERLLLEGLGLRPFVFGWPPKIGVKNSNRVPLKGYCKDII